MGERLRPAAGGVPPSTSPVVSPLPRGLQPQCPPRPLPPLPARCPPVRLLAPGPCLELRLGGGRIKPRLCQVPKTTEAPNVPLSSAPSLATPQLVPPLRSPPCGRGGRGSRPPSAAGRRPHQALFMGSEEQKLASIDFISITSENQSFPKTAFKRLSGGEYRVLSRGKYASEYPSKAISKKSTIGINISTVYARPRLHEDMQLNLRAFCLRGRPARRLADQNHSSQTHSALHNTPNVSSHPPARRSGPHSIINHGYLLGRSGERIGSVRNSSAPGDNYHALPRAQHAGCPSAGLGTLKGFQRGEIRFLLELKNFQTCKHMHTERALNVSESGKPLAQLFY